MSVLVLAALLLVMASGTAVVLTRDPRDQALVASVHGLLLALLFLLLRAPDVALSQLGIGTVILPVLILAALRTTRRREEEGTAGDDGADRTTGGDAGPHPERSS